MSGFQQNKVIPVLKDVGSALAASGRINELPFAIKALGDIQAKGKLAGQEIIQLANAGLPAIKILSGALGKTNAEILALSESGQISSDVFIKSTASVFGVEFWRRTRSAKPDISRRDFKHQGRFRTNVGSRLPSDL